MDISVGQAIRKIKKEGLNHSYFLLGDDYFLQKFFKNYVKNKFDSNIIVKHLDLSESIDLEFFLNEVSTISLFNSKNVFCIRNFDKINTKDKKIISTYLDKSKLDENILIFIIDDYIIKNTFSKTIYSKSIAINTNTPFFSKKIKDWAKFYMIENKINIDDQILDFIINSYGDNISNVINEIEKISLISNDRKLVSSDYVSNYKNKNLKYWNLMHSLGVKNLKESIHVFNVLIVNGHSLVPIITSLSTFYISMYDSYYRDTIHSSFKINNTIRKNMKLYKGKYTHDEIINIIIQLKNLDVIIKSANISSDLLFEPFILKICKGMYESN